MAAWGRTVPGTHGSKHGPGWRAVDGTGTARTGFLNALTLVAEKPHSTIYSTYEQLTGCGLGSLTSHPTWPSSTLSNGVLSAMRGGRGNGACKAAWHAHTARGYGVFGREEAAQTAELQNGGWGGSVACHAKNVISTLAGCLI